MNYKHILINDVQHIQAVNPFPQYQSFSTFTGSSENKYVNPEWQDFDKANPPIVWYGPAFDGTISDEEIEKFWQGKAVRNGNWNEYKEKPSPALFQRQASRPKEVEQPVQFNGSETEDEQYIAFELPVDGRLKQISIAWDNLEDGIGFLETMREGMHYSHARDTKLILLKKVAER